MDNAIADAVFSFSAERNMSFALKHSAEANQRLGFLVHELRNSIITATLAVSALERESLPLSGATDELLKRSLETLTTLITKTVAGVRLDKSVLVRDEVFFSGLAGCRRAERRRSERKLQRVRF